MNGDDMYKHGHHHNGDQAARRPQIIVLDLRPLIWVFDESCSIVHGITSEP